MRRTPRFALLITVALAAWSCDAALDRPADAEDIVGPQATVIGTGCDFQAVRRAARDFFPKAQDRGVQDLLRQAESACDADDDALTTDIVLDVFANMRIALENGTAGDAADGANLASDLLVFLVFDCVLNGTCDPIDLGLDFTDALMSGGALAVVGGDATPAHDGHVVDEASAGVFSRGLDPAWVVEPGPAGGTWAGSLGVRSLIYGSQAINAADPLEVELGPTRYDWNVIPHPVARFPNQLVVGICQPPDPGDVNPTVQRKLTILESAEPAACTSGLAAAPSFGERLFRLAARTVDPRPLPLFASAQTRGGGVGGLAGNFTVFYEVDAELVGELEFITQPAPVNVVGEPIGGPVRVLAKTSLGTPIELIDVQLTAITNNGSNVVLGNDTETTIEEGGFATFSDLTLNKPGGYTLCAEAVGDTRGFTLASACSEPLHVRQNN